MSITVSAKVDRMVVEKAKKYGINISEVMREALKREVERREREELLKKLRRAGEILRKIPEEEIARLIREDRER